MNPTPCADNPDLWFDTERHATRLAVLACGDCPIIAECLQRAMTAEAGWSRASRHGIFGGLTPEERADLDGRPSRKVARKVAQCGTPSGYNAHRRKGEAPCQDCNRAHAEAVRRAYRPKGAAA